MKHATLLIAALALGAGQAQAERTMEPLQVMEMDRNGSSSTNEPDTDKEAERVLDSDRRWSYQNDRSDAQQSGGEPVCAQITADSDHDFIRRAECGTSIGNGDFGAAYSLYAGVYAWDRGANDKMRMDAGFDTRVTVLGRERTIIGAEAFFESTQDGSNFGRTEVVVLDQVVQGASRQLEVDLSYQWGIDRPFFSASTQVPVGGVFSVALEAGATGSLGATLSGGVASDIEVGFTPSLALTGYASASVAVLGGAVAEAGVEVNLRILKVSLPMDLKIGVLPTSDDPRRWSLGIDLDLESLSGWVDVFVSAAFGTIYHEKTVASWDGFQKTFELISKRGDINF